MTTQRFHPGELQVQAALGERAIAERTGRSIASAIMTPAFGYLERLPMLVVGLARPDDGCELTLVFGTPGFMRPRADGRRLVIDLERGDDPVIAALAVGSRLGCLAIDPSTRRRLRVNGTIVEREPERLELDVVEAYANCPKHIPTRELPTTPPRFTTTRRGTRLEPELRAMIRASDSFFVATSNPEGHADASHRGGPPGFVTVTDDVLEIPDFRGNSMFNTLGNLAINPAAALLFIDWERGRLLHLGGRSQLDLPRRSWRFSVERWFEQSFEPAG